MPNYVANIVKLVGSDEQIKKVLDFVKGEEGDFDFNKIVPMPKDLDIESSSVGTKGVEVIKSLASGRLPDTTEFDECVVLGAKYLYNKIKYGFETWYEWCRIHWGTKWNACYPVVSKDDGEIRFDTAWSAPLPVLKALSKKFPEVTVKFVYADEDYGNNTGRGEIVGGEMSIYNPTNGSDEAINLYFETHPGAEDYIKKNESGEWEWIED